MERALSLCQDYLWIPIAKERPKRLLEIFREGEKKLEFNIPVGASCGEDYLYDFYAAVSCGELKGGELTLRGDFPESFFHRIRQSGAEPSYPAPRPQIHFTAGTGWINDPNGLVYRDGIYHMYFQYNPFDTEWDNMSWGHAVSRDLLRWERCPAVLYPDGEGMIFSGCGLVNDRGCLGLPEDALLFFYSAAGDANPWSRGKVFTQRLAVSLDGGRTLRKREDWVMPAAAAAGKADTAVCRENRDPKVFWHEPTGAYVMTLWLRDNEFGIFTSPDLREFELSQRLTLPGAWECPDLLCLPVEGEELRRWVFWSADGYYYLGDFDGRTFVTDGERLEAYATKLPYAAQTFSGVSGRCISIAWLRAKNPGKHYRGVMSLPRELTLRRTDRGLRLVQRYVREWERERREIFFEEGVTSLETGLEARESGLGGSGSGPDGPGAGPSDSGPLEAVLLLEAGSSLDLEILYTKISYRPAERVLSVGEEQVCCPEELCELSVLFDGEIIEITGNSGIISAVFERERVSMNGYMRLRSASPVTVRLYRLPHGRGLGLLQ